MCVFFVFFCVFFFNFKRIKSKKSIFVADRGLSSPLSPRLRTQKEILRKEELWTSSLMSIFDC